MDIIKVKNIEKDNLKIKKFNKTTTTTKVRTLNYTFKLANLSNFNLK
jgi:hypothetical protein